MVEARHRNVTMSYVVVWHSNVLPCVVKELCSSTEHGIGTVLLGVVKVM